MEKSYRDLNPGVADLFVGLVKDSSAVPDSNSKKVYKQVSRSGMVNNKQDPDLNPKNPDMAKAQVALPDLKKPAVSAPPFQAKNDRVKDIDQDLVLTLDLGSSSLLNGLILSEVLGKPKCMRRGRWY